MAAQGASRTVAVSGDTTIVAVVGYDAAADRGLEREQPPRSRVAGSKWAYRRRRIRRDIGLVEHRRQPRVDRVCISGAGRHAELENNGTTSLGSNGAASSVTGAGRWICAHRRDRASQA
jgi:hypothetical protein